MKPIALVGACGFVGSRMIERSHLLGGPPVVPIARSWRSYGRLARFGLPLVRGDAGNVDSLIPALKGCGMAVNLTMGDDRRIASDAKSIHAACREAGVPVLVHISSAEVFGRAENPGLTENSMPDGRHWMEYGRKKAAAEMWLMSQTSAPVTVVILRPGLIWGPGSGWLVRPAQAILDGAAYLFNEGRGICNLIHIDNLIEHIKLLAQSTHVQQAVYNISDPETLTWADYYHAIAREIGVDPSTIHMLPASAFRETTAQKFLSALANKTKQQLSTETKQQIKRLRSQIFPPPAENQLIIPRPLISKQMWWIQGTRRKLPSGAFVRLYPEIKQQSFPQLMGAAGNWLRHAGFQANADTAFVPQSARRRS